MFINAVKQFQHHLHFLLPLLNRLQCNVCPPSAELHGPSGALGLEHCNSAAMGASIRYKLQRQPTETLHFLVENEILQIAGFISSGMVPSAEQFCQRDAP